MLDKKITEIDQLKSQLCRDLCRKTEPASLEVPVSVTEENINTNNLSHYQTFPKQKNKNHQNPPKTPERPVKHVTTLRKSSSARHSVQICQVSYIFFYFTNWTIQKVIWWFVATIWHHPWWWYQNQMWKYNHCTQILRENIFACLEASFLNLLF